MDAVAIFGIDAELVRSVCRTYDLGDAVVLTPVIPWEDSAKLQETPFYLRLLNGDRERVRLCTRVVFVHRLMPDTVTGRYAAMGDPRFAIIAECAKQWKKPVFHISAPEPLCGTGDVPEPT